MCPYFAEQSVLGTWFPKEQLLKDLPQSLDRLGHFGADRLPNLAFRMNLHVGRGAGAGDWDVAVADQAVFGTAVV